MTNNFEYFKKRLAKLAGINYSPKQPSEGEEDYSNYTIPKFKYSTDFKNKKIISEKQKETKENIYNDYFRKIKQIVEKSEVISSSSLKYLSEQESEKETSITPTTGTESISKEKEIETPIGRNIKIGEEGKEKGEGLTPQFQSQPEAPSQFKKKEEGKIKFAPSENTEEKQKAKSKKTLLNNIIKAVDKLSNYIQLDNEEDVVMTLAKRIKSNVYTEKESGIKTLTSCLSLLISISDKLTDQELKEVIISNFHKYIVGNESLEKLADAILNQEKSEIPTEQKETGTKQEQNVKTEQPTEKTSGEVEQQKMEIDTKEETPEKKEETSGIQVVS